MTSRYNFLHQSKMTTLLGMNSSISLDSIGCFRSELAKACGEKTSAALRRWHGDQVRLGYLKEGQDFVVVRQSPDQRRHDDDIFYFQKAVELCKQRRPGKAKNFSPIELRSLRSMGFQIVEGQVVKRLQLNLFASSELGFLEEVEKEVGGISPFSSLRIQNFDGIKIIQRHTDGYLRADKFCQAIGQNWTNIYSQIYDTNTDIGLRLQMLASVFRTDVSTLVQVIQEDISKPAEVWIHPSFAHSLAQMFNSVLAEALYNNGFDIRFSDKPSPQLTENSELARRINTLSEAVSEAMKSVERQFNNINKILLGISREQQQQKISDFWNQKIQRYTEGRIETPFEFWKVLKQRPTVATQTHFPYVYVIIVYPPHNIVGFPDIFYVGRSSVQPSSRFSSHDGLKSVETLERYGYSYEIRYYESEIFSIPAELQRMERALQLALDPYWELLDDKKRQKAKRGELLTGGLFTRLLPRVEIPRVS